MLRYVVRRLLAAIPVLWGAVTISFLALHLVPGDPVTILLGGAPSTPAVEQALRHKLGLDNSLAAQYFTYLGHVLQGNFGSSITANDSVSKVISTQLPATVQLTVTAAILTVVLGLLAGVSAAVSRRKWVDRVMTTIEVMCISMPSFWFGFLCITVFSFKLGWFPAVGNQGVRSLVLPAITLAIPGAAIIAQLVRDGMKEVLHEPFVTTARAKGLPARAVNYRHALRNALIPTITVMGVVVGNLMAGAVIIETVFGRQGVGRVALSAIQSKDLPVVQGTILLAAIVYVVVNIAIDLLYAAVDPRIRESIAT